MIREFFCCVILLFYSSVIISLSAMAPYLDRKLFCPGYCNLIVERENSFNSSSNDQKTTTTSIEKCSFIADTMSCERRSRELLENSLLLNSPTSGVDSVLNKTIWYDSVRDHLSGDVCGSDILDVDIFPYLFSTSKNYQPFVRINVTISVKDRRTTAVSMRHTCLASAAVPDGIEELCLNHSRPAWGRFYWPCRMFDFTDVLTDDDAQLSVPANFSYDCFRAAPLALMTIRVAMYPQMCENEYVYRMINDHHLNADKLEDWLPMVFVDTNDERFVRVRYRTPLKVISDLTSIIIDVVDRRNQEVIQTKTVNVKENSANITNLKRGEYAAVVYALNTKCVNSKCISTYVPFNLTRDYDEAPSSKEEPPTKVWVPISIAIGVILIVVMIVALSLSLYCRAKILRRRREAVAIQFVDRPKVFIIYTDDNVEHRKCVIYLAEYLRDTTNCEVFFDEFTFRNPSSRSSMTTTTEWVHSCLTACDYCLLLFSEGCKITFDSSRSYELIDERPWQEVFGLSITYVLDEILRETQADPRTKLTKFICATFSYSDENCIPSLFRSLPCRRYRLMNDLAELICHLHKITPERFDSTSPLGCNRLSSHVDRTRLYYEISPTWLNRRLTPINNNNRTFLINNTCRNGDIAHISAAIESLQIRRDDDKNINCAIDERNLDDLYAETKLNTSGKYPLLPPSSNGELASKKNYVLIPPDDDIDDDIVLDSNRSSDLPLMSINSNHNCRNSIGQQA